MWFAFAFTAQDGEAMLQEIATRSSGKRQFNFNMFEVVIDVDAQSVEIYDVTDASREGEEIVPIAAFVEMIRKRLEASRG